MKHRRPPDAQAMARKRWRNVPPDERGALMRRAALLYWTSPAGLARRQLAAAKKKFRAQMRARPPRRRGRPKKEQ